MANPTTYRNDMVAGVKAFLDTYVTANPTLLRRAYRARPESLADLPMAFVDLRPEAIHFWSGTMVRTIEPGFIVVDRLTNNDEAMQRFDILVDSVVDALRALNGRLTEDSIFSDITISDIAFPQGDSEFMAVRFGFPGTSKTEGRA